MILAQYAFTASGQSNLTSDCIAATSFAPPPANQIKWHLDLFSHFCTAHGRVSSGMHGRVLSAKTCSLVWGSGLPSNTCFLGSIRVHNPNGISIGSAVFAQLMAQSCRRCHVCPSPQNCPSHGESEPHLIRCSMGPPDSASQTASRSVQPFMHSSRQTVPIYFTMAAAPVPAPKYGPSQGGIWPTTQTAFRPVQPFLHGLLL